MSPSTKNRKKLPPLSQSIIDAVGQYQKRYEFSSWARAAADLIVRGLRVEGYEVELPESQWGGSRYGD